MYVYFIVLYKYYLTFLSIQFQICISNIWKNKVQSLKKYKKNKRCTYIIYIYIIEIYVIHFFKRFLPQFLKVHSLLLHFLPSFYFFISIRNKTVYLYIVNNHFISNGCNIYFLLYVFILYRNIFMTR